MSIQLRFAWVGLKEAIHSFDGLGRNVSGKQLIAGVVAGAMHIRNKASANAPYLTGTLRRSIHIGGYTNLTPGFNEAEGYTDIGGNVATDAEAKVEVGTNLIYAPVQEFGATICAKNKPWLHFKTRDGQWHKVKCVTVPAHPYMRPAFDTEQQNVIKEVDYVVDKLIKESGF